MWSPFGPSKGRNPSTKQHGSDQRSPSPSSILAETLRKNPFRTSSKEHVRVHDENRAAKFLNKDLNVLADFFPDVQYEVLRELLKRFDGDSRLPICTEQLSKYKAEWARGRLRNPPRELGDTIPQAEQFRTKAYIAAAAQTLSWEFKSSSKSAINAVLAEVNDSYSKARPILFDITHKSRWNIFSNPFRFRKKKTLEDIPPVLLEKTSGLPAVPVLVVTGSFELDEELDALFLRPAQAQAVLDQEAGDLNIAQTLNQDQAREAEALFECQVCYDDVPFEEITTCTYEAHVVCNQCVRRTLQEAVFGQGFNEAVNPHLGTLKCLSSTDECPGHISQHQVERAVLGQKSGTEIWTKFETRVAEYSLGRSNLDLVRCQFCSYAEVDTPSTPTTTRQLRWHFKRPAANPLFLILLCELLPTLLFLAIPLMVFMPYKLINMFYTSLAHLVSRQRSIRFKCLNPSCARSTCLKCSKPFHNPHICHEPLILSLRTTVEAARTTAIKRTCPRCGTSFVKSSGCNKLTCVCGYSMCYLCRANIGKAGSAGNAEGAVGYRHFCEHFRPNGGNCADCDKCDLYKSESEDEVVRRAGEEAERQWREKEGMVGVKGLEEATGNLAGEDSMYEKIRRGGWSLQEIGDWIVERCVVVERGG